MTDNPNRAQRFEEVAGLIRRSAKEMSAHEDAEGLQRFRQLLTRPSKTRYRIYVPLALAGALVMIVIFLVSPGLRRQPAAQLTYQLERTELQAGGYFASSSHGDAKLLFSDGTRLEFAAGARGRLLGIDAEGARIAVEEGRARARVFRGSSSRWLFHAGPFVVTVTGTSFDMRWTAQQQVLEIEMHEGTVVVRGPLPTGEIKLRARERLTVRARENEVLIRNVEDSPVLDDSASGEPNLADLAVGPEPESEPNPSSQPKNAESVQAPLGLAELLATGRPAAVLARAESRGIDWCLANANSEDLAALSDAARYGGRDALAQRALSATRTRFPRTPRAHDAAFFLGRNVEARSPSEALQWYERYLTEAGSGLYAREALGRKLALVQQLAGRDKARPVAEEYLRRYPTGDYVKVARAVLEGK